MIIVSASSVCPSRYSAHWLVRHTVTQREWPDASQLRLDEEGLAACWAWESFFLGMRIEGMVYNELRATPGTDLPQSQLFRRTRCTDVGRRLAGLTLEPRAVYRFPACEQG